MIRRRATGIQRSTARGFTLIEALIAMIVVAIAVVAMMGLVPYGFNQIQTNSIDVQAVAVGQQFLEDERTATLHSSQDAMPTATTVPIDPGQSYYNNGAAPNTNYGNFSIVPDGCSTVVNNGSTQTLNQCSVTVSWTEAGASKSVTVQSYVSH
jgi:uncharacterized protein (TIGR02598 family)